MHFVLSCALVLQAVHATDIAGRPFTPFAPAGPLRVLFFVSSDCPVSNGYAPDIQRLCREYAPRGVKCSLAYEDVDIDAAAVRAHLEEYRYQGMIAAIDRDRAFARRARASVTPEAVLVDSKGEIRYRGRIDNRYIDFGKPRRVVTAFDLRDAIEAVLAGKPAPHPETPAVGCYIAPGSLERRSPEKKLP
jgi:hypothetical protein